MSEKNTKLAEDRTNWAEDRTILANERTFAGWMRTGMAAVALALGLRALFGEFEPAWVPKAGASLLIVVSLFIFCVAWKSAKDTQTRLSAHEAEAQSGMRIGLIAFLMATSAAVTGVILWYL